MITTIDAWCTFRAGGHTYAIPVERVQEVLRPVAITPVPLAPAAVRGLLHLRGDIVTVVDLAAALALPPAALVPESHVVVRDGALAVSLLVESIGDVSHHAPGSMQPAPRTLNARTRSLVVGTVPRAHDLLLVLDLDAVLDAAFAPAGGPELREGARESA